MTRKCSSCGIPAPDGESKFCNRCGSPIIDEPEAQFPVCGSCGAEVADPLAQFCDKCGGPLVKAMVCPACGNPAIDENSRFCTRCGTTFDQPQEPVCPSCGFAIPDDQAVFCNRCGASLRPSAPPAVPATVITPKRQGIPIQDEPVAEWDPWTDGTPEFEGEPQAPQDSPAAYTPQPAPEPDFRSAQIRMPPKKYSHLPLVADEMKDYKAPAAPAPGEHPATPVKKKSPGNFLKR